MKEVSIGDVVDAVTASGEPVKALVVYVHSQNCINTVFMSPDPAKTDTYGRQIERMDSLSRKEEGVTAPGGRYFEA